MTLAVGDDLSALVGERGEPARGRHTEPRSGPPRLEERARARMEARGEPFEVGSAGFGASEVLLDAVDLVPDDGTLLVGRPAPQIERENAVPFGISSEGRRAASDERGIAFDEGAQAGEGSVGRERWPEQVGIASELLYQVMATL